MSTVYVVRPNESDLSTPDKGIVDRFISINMGAGTVSFSDSPEDADLIILFQKWSFKQRDYVEELIRDPFFSRFSHKLYVINYDSTVGEGFLPGGYVSLRNSSRYNPEWFKSIAYPKCYNPLLENPGSVEAPAPNQLFWFRGTLKSHPVRLRLHSLLRNSKNGQFINVDQLFHEHTESDYEVYVRELENTKFVLCPRGTSPNSYRLYESMSVGRCPVIISDDWVQTEGPNWDACSVRIAEKDVNYLEDILLEREKDAHELGAKAKSEWHRFFSTEAKNLAYMRLLLNMHESLCEVDRSVHAHKKYWQSKQFLRNNEWAFSQRLNRLISRKLGQASARIFG